MSAATIPLSNIADVIRGVTYDKTQTRRDNAIGYVGLLRATNINDGRLDFDDLVFVPRGAVKDVQMLNRGDIVMAASSGSLSVVGKAALVTQDVGHTFGAFCYVVRPHGESVLPEYLAYYMRSSEYRTSVSQLAAGVNINNLRREHIESLKIPVVNAASQRRIVEFLDSHLSRLDAATQALQQAEAKLKAYRASVLKAAVEGRLVPTEPELAHAEQRDYEPGDVLLKRILAERRRRWEEAELAKMKAAGKTPKDDKWKVKYQEPAKVQASDLPIVPEGWAVARAEQISEFITKGTTPEASRMTQGTGDIPYIKVYNLTFDGGLDFTVNPTFVDVDTHSKELSRSRCFPGDVLMNIVGPPLGKVSIVPPTHGEWNINQAIARFRPVPGVLPEYLSIVLMSDRTLRWATQKSKATAGQFNLTLEIARDVPVPLPPVSEQRRICDEVGRRLSTADAVLAEVAKNEHRIGRLRQSILKWAFEGNLVDQDPNDELAEQLLERISAKRVSEAPAKKTARRRKTKAAQ